MERDFLQSSKWRRFQESVGQKTFQISSDDFWANVIEHKLPVVGNYFYIPRGPVIATQKNFSEKIKELLDLAKKEKIGWIRIEPKNKKTLEIIQKNFNFKIKKAPHDMQPKELFIIDISPSKEDLLKKMKSKTRYNIRLASKKEVSIKVSDGKNIENFLRLNKVMAKRQEIKTHDDSYYRKMFKIISSDTIKLYEAKYKDETIAANIMIFHENFATYLHGASDDKYKNLMAPFLLQWTAIQDAKEKGCMKYDFGGVKVNEKNGKSWEGITRFKLGFSPETSPTQFPGSYDIIISSWKYNLYKILQFLKNLLN